MAAFFEEEDFRKKVEKYSGGMKRRLSFLRAMLFPFDFLLLDEPFGALDAKVRKELRTWLRDIHHNLGVTSILVTHDQEEALEVSDEIVVMNHGKIEQTGSAEAIYRKPENAFVTEFLGETDAFEVVSKKASGITTASRGNWTRTTNGRNKPLSAISARTNGSLPPKTKHR